MMMWAVIRDGEFYEVVKSRRQARSLASCYRPGSKHKWTVDRVWVYIDPRE